MKNNKKKYGDEEIIKYLNEYKKGIQGDIKEGFIICEDLYRFKRREIIKNKMSMCIPIRFDCYKDEKAKEINVIDNPDVMYINVKGNIQIMFKLTSEEITSLKLKEYIDDIQLVLMTLNDDVKIIESDAITLFDDKKIFWFDYQTYFGNFQVYIMFFSIEIQGMLLYGKFSCEYRKSILWKTVFIAMLKTVEII